MTPDEVVPDEPTPDDVEEVRTCEGFAGPGPFPVDSHPSTPTD